jgi:branched-chain amino acid transport system substrate-binding protein
MVRTRFMRGAAVMCAFAFAAAACGSDDEATGDSSPPATDAATTQPAATDAPTEATDAPTEATDAPTEATDAPASDDPLGEPNPATGEPLQVVYMWSGVSPAVDNSSDLASAQAVVQWINEYGGGIGPDHRELELIDCAAPDSAIAATCGTTIVESGTPIVLFNVIGDVEPWATPTIAAGIPILAYSSADASLLAAPDSVFTLSNPIAGIGQFPAVLAADLGVAKSVVDVINVPAAVGPAQAFAPTSFEAAGAGEVTVVPIDPTAPDHGPDVQAALQNGPELWHIIGNPAYCSLSIRALKDAQFEGAISGISNCIDAAALEQLGADIEGTYISYSGGEDPSNADYARYLAILEKYDPSITPNGTPVGASIVLEGFRRLMEDYSGDYDSASITEHIRNHDPLDLPSMEGATFQCNSTALAGIIPIACTKAFAYTQLDADGKPTTFTYVSG